MDSFRRALIQRRRRRRSGGAIGRDGRGAARWRKQRRCRIVGAPDLDFVHDVHRYRFMSTAYVSGRVPARYARLVAKQARAAKTSKSDMVARYVIEKSLETRRPFRLDASPRQAGSRLRQGVSRGDRSIA
jgi:hypothetical protein